MANDKKQVNGFFTATDVEKWKEAAELQKRSLTNWIEYYLTQLAEQQIKQHEQQKSNK